jgi:hypothetical protein
MITTRGKARFIALAWVALSAGPAFGNQLQGGASQTMLDPGIITDGGQDTEGPCFYGEQQVNIGGHTETIYATIKAYNHPFDNVKLHPQNKVPRLIGALSGYVETQKRIDGGLDYLKVVITRVYSAKNPGDYIQLEPVITMGSFREVTCPGAKKQAAPKPRAKKTGANCYQFKKAADDLPPSPGNTGKCELMCMYNICQQTGLTSTPLFNQCGRCE